jgi:two-component system response regulator HydG/two-component system response regulator AtoC
LFGHKKGSFTGAITDKAGLLEQAHNGVFFLDEIGDCSAAIQAKLLRVIQEKEVLPVGGLCPKKINLRFIAATHQDLEKMISEEHFRLDLYQRLNAFTFRIPALRDRPEDIEFYSRLFINDFGGGKHIRIEESGLDVLKAHRWYGNVRELSNVIQRIVVFSKRNCLDHKSAIEALNSKDIKISSIKETKDYGPEQIIDALQRAKGNRTVAASILVMHKTTLHRYINKYKLRDIIEKRNVGRPSFVYAEE